VSERPDPLAPPEGYGRHRELQGSYQPDEGCWMHSHQCRQPVVAVVVLADLQEHVLRVNNCEEHLRVTRQGLSYCTACKDAAEREGIAADPALRIMEITRLDGRAPDYDPRTEAAIHRVFTGGDGQFA
jgi:hypothetical protein